MNIKKYLRMAHMYLLCRYRLGNSEFIRFRSSNLVINIGNINTIYLKSNEHIVITMTGNSKEIHIRSHAYAEVTGLGEYNESKEFIEWLKSVFNLGKGENHD